MPAQSTTPSPSPLPPGTQLYQLAVGHYVSRALDLAVRLGVADVLAMGPQPAEVLARATDTHAPSLRRVLRLLASVGVLAEDERGRFELTPLGELLREDVPGSMKAMISVFAGVSIQDSWRELEFCVRTGEPAFKQRDPDADAFTSMEDTQDGGATFDKAMAAFAPQTAAAVCAAYDFSGIRRLMDVGGGNGALLIGILRACPNLHGIVFDRPPVAERARAEVEAAGLSDRIQVAAGSFFDSVPGGTDAILMKHVIHDWNDTQAAQILKACRAVLPADGRLLIVEGLYPERIDASLASRAAAANDCNMLVVAGGRQRSEAEFRSLLGAAGFELRRVVPTAARVVVIESTPA